MNTEIIISLIGLAGSAIGSIIGIMASAKLTTYRIEQLEQKVSKHNSLIERTYMAEKNIEVMGEKLSSVGQRVEELEKGDCFEK